MRYDIDSLNQINILEVAEILGIAVKNKKAHCFLHSDHTPSLAFFPDSNKWYCFGCSKGGTVIDLVKEHENLTFTQACRWLADRFDPASRSRIDISNHSHITRPSRAPSDQKSPDYELNRHVAAHLKLSKPAKKYLCDQRGLSESVLQQNHVVSLDDPQELYTWLTSSYGEERLLAAGYLAANDEGRIYQVWRDPGVVFPYFDFQGRAANLQLRPYRPGDGKSKYLFLRGIGTCLYNEIGLSQLQNDAEIFVCEGAVDALSILSFGQAAVGLPGAAAMKKEWIDELKRYRVHFVFDNDNAGITNLNQYYKEFLNLNINASKWKVPEPYNDVNEWLVAQKGIANETIDRQ